MSESGTNKTEECLRSILLDHYHCTFFLPVIFPQAENCLSAVPNRGAHRYSASTKGADAQAFYFFTPTLRNILFEQTDTQGNRLQQTLEPVREWRIENPGWELVLEKPLKDSDPETALSKQIAQVEAIHLYQYFNKIYLLSFRVAPACLTDDMRSELADSKAQYLDDLEEGVRERFAPLQLEAWLRFTRLARVLYPSFMEQDEEYKIAPLTLKRSGLPDLTVNNGGIDLDIPDYVGQDLSSVLQVFFAEFFPTEHREAIKQHLSRYIQLYDDRMFVSVAYGLAGEKHSDGTLNRVNALVGTTDRVADTFAGFQQYPYAPAALADYLKGRRFELWKDLGGTYTFTDMVNAYVYCGWDFRTIIAPKVIPYIYDRMLVQALFYQASLRYYDQEITQGTKQLLEYNDIKGILAQRREFIRFTNQYWFREVTNQMQGREIFRLQQAGLEVEEHYQLLQDEISRTNDYLQAFHENRIALWALLIGIIATLPVINDIFKTETSMWQSVVESFGGCQLQETGSVKPGCADLLTRFLLSVLVLSTVLLAWRYGGSIWRFLKKSARFLFGKELFKK